MGPCLTTRGLDNLINNILSIKRIQVLRIYFNGRFLLFLEKNWLKKKLLERKNLLI